jgi:Tol biopolymer transport system component
MYHVIRVGNRIVINNMISLFAVFLITMSIPAFIYAENTTDKIVFISEQANNGVYQRSMFLVDGLDGKPVEIIPNKPPLPYFPSLSPDGKEIAFVRSGNIYKMSIAERKLEQLTNNTAQDTQYSALDWSPDGTKILFLTATPKTNPSKNICIMDIQSRRIDQLKSSPTFRAYPHLSPDGSKILYAEGDSPMLKYDLFVMDIASKKVTNITQTPDVLELYPVWLSNSKITFVSRAVSSPVGMLPVEAFTMNANGSELRSLKLSFEYNLSGWAWSPDGLKILYTTTTSTTPPPLNFHRNTYLMDVTSGTKNSWMDNATEIDWVRSH